MIPFHHQRTMVFLCASRVRTQWIAAWLKWDNSRVISVSGLGLPRSLVSSSKLQLYELNYRRRRELE